MKYSLDTNTCIRYLNGRSAGIRQKLLTVPAHDIVVCSIVRGELAYGAAKSQSPAHEIGGEAAALLKTLLNASL